jgi:hypothetical protein
VSPIPKLVNDDRVPHAAQCHDQSVGDFGVGDNVVNPIGDFPQILAFGLHVNVGDPAKLEMIDLGRGFDARDLAHRLQPCGLTAVTGRRRDRPDVTDVLDLCLPILNGQHVIVAALASIQ